MVITEKKQKMLNETFRVIFADGKEIGFAIDGRNTKSVRVPTKVFLKVTQKENGVWDSKLIHSEWVVKLSTKTIAKLILGELPRSLAGHDF